MPVEATADRPRTISDLAGNWTLDPARSAVRSRTKALWVESVNGAFDVTGSCGTVDAFPTSATQSTAR